MSETPLYDELEEKWSAVGTDQRICDKYMRCFLIETGAEWYEDEEGNEVFLEPQYAEGGVIKETSPEVQRLLENFDNDCPVAVVPKRKFKLFGRNQETRGTL